MAETKSKRWPRVGTLRRGETGSSYIKLDEGYKIVGPDGQTVPMNSNRTIRLENPRDTVTGLFNRGFINEAEKDKRLEKLAENEWLRYELVCPPPKES